MAHSLTRDNPNKYDGVSSDFYMACKHNELDRVRDMIKNRSKQQLNQIESNGGTSLHAVIYYNYPDLIELLLEHGCNPDIEDRHQQTARDYIRDEQIKDLVEKYAPNSTKAPIPYKTIDHDQVRKLFDELNRCASAEDDVPLESIITVYKTWNDNERLSRLERILRVRWKIYSINRYKRPTVNNFDHIRSIFEKVDAHKSDEYKVQCKEVKKLLDDYEQTKNAQYLLQLYYATNSLEILHHDSIQMELYAHLPDIPHGGFQGQTYRGRVLTVDQLLPIQWAFRHPDSILELRQFTCTLLKRPVAEKHIEKLPKDSKQLRALFIYDISSECHTAIDIDDAPSPDTHGIRLLSGTFLEVTNVQQDIDNGILEIHLKTVPVPLNVIIQATKELES